MAARLAGDAFAGGGVPQENAVPRARLPLRALAPAQQEDEPDESLAAEQHLDSYLRHVFIPWRRIGGLTVVAIADDTPQVRAAVFETTGRDVVFDVIAKQKIVDALQQRFRVRLAHDAQFALGHEHPEFSAQHLLSRRQAVVALSLIATTIAGAVALPETFQIVAFSAIALLYFVNIAFRYVLHIEGWPRRCVNEAGKQQRSARLRDAELPIYTVLVPLFREANMMPRITSALRRLDYPAEKLDIKLILEEVDTETIAATRALNLEDRFEVLVVPNSDVRTKPRACNYAMRFARGDLTVIFDAEDRPEPDQLRKAVHAFRRSPGVACFQARLGYFNADRNWLSKFFAIEYAGWFAVMLPGLARLGIPIPLGGTSNHFRTSVLREIGGWDAYNVTEDADVGLRLARAGYRAAPLASVTWEEANFCVFSWIRQRSRWIKGYIQTALVHARDPRAFARAVGWWRYLACMTFITGSVLGCLVSPILWLLSLIWWVTASGPEGIAYVALFGGSLMFGIGVLTVLTMLGPLATGEDRLAVRGAGICIYWLLMSAAAYKGLFQLLNGKASFWEKTDHGIEHCTPRRTRPSFPRLAYASSALAVSALALTSYAALGNPWPKQEGGGEVVTTLRALRSIDGFAAEPSSSGALDLHGEYGVTNSITIVTDNEVKTDGAGRHFEFSMVGARASVARWDTGVISLQAEIGAGDVRDARGEFGSPRGTGEARVLFGQDFDLWGNHSWFAMEAGYRWHGGPPADEAVLDLTLGVQPRDDLFFMLQSFGVDTINEPTGGYRMFKSNKLQLSVVYEIVPHVWVQAGGIASVYGNDRGNAGGVLALWWRF